MNHVREQWNEGIAPSQREGFRRLVRNTVILVEKACREQHIKPDQLPGPTFRAYQYLKELDLDHLPAPSQEPIPTTKRLHISHIIALCNEIQKDLGNLSSKDDKGKGIEQEKSRLLQKIQRNTGVLEAIFAQSKMGPEALPPQSRRAYQWLKYLNEPGNLDTHLEGLKVARKTLDRYTVQVTHLTSSTRLKPSLQFYHLSAIYKVLAKGKNLTITAHEAFVEAPPEVISALVAAALDRKNKRELKIVRDYAAGDDFIEASLALELMGVDGHTTSDPRLVKSFQRMNRTYFNGKLNQPRLVWNQTITHQKFGHYQPATDTIMISISLDHPDVPEYVLDFVMYHELLHKQLGIQSINGRHYAHTPQFRALERSHSKYQQAQDFLNNYGANRRSSHRRPTKS